MAQTFNCPNCGAPLDYQGSDPIIRCPYCNSSVIVPENLRARPSFSSTPNNFTLSGVGGFDLGSLMAKAQAAKRAKDLAEAGDFDQAISVYQEATGVDDFSARQAVEALAAGRPITLAGGSGFTAADVAARVRMVSTPELHVGSIPPARRGNNSLGCVLGCGITALVLGILAVTLLPLFGGLAGIFAGVSGIPGVELPEGIELPEGVEIPEIAIPGGFATRELSFGGEGTGPGLFKDGRAIAVDPNSGEMFVAEYDESGRIQAFDAEGKFVTQWVVEEQVNYIQRMAVDRQGQVLVCVNGKILRFDKTGKLLGKIESPFGSDPWDHYEDFALLPDGKIVAVSRGENLVWMDADGKIEQRVDAAVSSISSDSELSGKVAVDGLGNVFVLAPFNNAVFKFDAKGKFTNRFGEEGGEPGQFRAASAIAVDGKGRVYISDIQGVQVFSNDGRYLDVIKVTYFAYGLAFDDQGRLYLTTNQKMVERYRISEEE